MEISETALTLEERVARLEGKLGWHEGRQIQLSEKKTIWAAGVMAVALCFAYRGLGMPNHYYQGVLAVLAVLLAYHRGWFAAASAKQQWLLGALNAAVLTLLFKLVIGGGVHHPFAWFRYPVMTAPPDVQGKWTLPHWDLSWQAAPLSEWPLDLTVIQTFLLLVTLVGGLFEFQPFISLTAFMLIVVSIPALVGFDWQWIFPAIVAAAVGLYLQTADANNETKEVKL